MEENERSGKVYKKFLKNFPDNQPPTNQVVECGEVGWLESQLQFCQTNLRKFKSDKKFFFRIHGLVVANRYAIYKPEGLGWLLVVEIS
jgi:hypothetical protein